MSNTTESLENWLNAGIPKAIKKLEQQHELCVKILKTITAAERRKRNYSDSLEDHGNLFPNLIGRYKRKIEISQMASERLWRRYFTACKSLTE